MNLTNIENGGYKLSNIVRKIVFVAMKKISDII